MAADRRLLVFTDLDATLLDEDYRFEPARPALTTLAEGGHPVVLASSKTLAEMTALHGALRTHRPPLLAGQPPVIAENGMVVAWPDGRGGFRPEVSTGQTRRRILEVAHGLRQAHGYRFTGFADGGPAWVREVTGLSEADAARACARLATEPISFEGDEPSLARFRAQLAAEGIRALRGGRFVHLMGEGDKATGMAHVLDRYRAAHPLRRWVTVALGDSPNDRAMLEAADRAVVIPNPRRATPLPVKGRHVVRADTPGPRGWAAAMADQLHDFDGASDG